MTISIRPIQTIAEYRACEALQRRVWSMPDDLEVVPLHLLLTVHKGGGLLLGAFDGEELVGFVFGFPGRGQDGRFKHSSHMLGVAPEFRSAGIGYQLKLAQRESALDQGFDVVSWTYDPLQSRNAYLNFHKLGTVCQTYFRDYYGPMTDELNVGLPSDRFQVDWWVASKRVECRLAGEAEESVLGSAFQVNATGHTRGGLLRPGGLADRLEAPVLRVEIPGDIQSIKSADPGLALEWRFAMRQVFETCFAAGYTVVDFLSHKTDSGRQSFYILRAE
jgi:predicted GNAT superfamily acetyltransferase